MLSLLNNFRRFIHYHSRVTLHPNPIMKVKVIPALEDNYMYLIVDDATQEAAIIDPVDPGKVVKAVNEEKVNLTKILITHHHWDHAGGNKELLNQTGSLPVYGNDDRIFGLTNKVVHDETFKIGSLNLRCLLTPCHTTGHTCFYVEDEEHPCVFTGDTLFIAACGKFFEGTGADMYHSLINVLSKLPDNTNVYCGHEYSVASLEFAEYTQPTNEDVKRKLEWARNQREEGLPCIPSTIGEEKSYNPFMRVNIDQMQQRCGTSEGIETMDYLRNEKNNFKRKQCSLK